MDDCVFCKIARGEIPARKIYENEHALVFHDLAPQAPVHALVIPKRHCQGTPDAAELGGEALRHLFLAAGEAAKILGVAETGFRLIINSGADACQTVGHLHLHLLGGRKLPASMV